jgi:hypothetical protein
MRGATPRELQAELLALLGRRAVRTMEAVLDPSSRVLFWDTPFGFEATGDTFPKTADLGPGLFGPKEDRLYFDATNFSWFAVFYPGGQMRVALLA